ncbi:MAG: efflux RND transporter periplasmic adaptor subunit [Polyangiaceae bacterium]
MDFVALAMMASCHRSTDVAETADAVAVHCEAPKTISVDDTVAIRGRIEPPPGGDLPVASQVAGRIALVNVHEGDTVKSGDVIASLDDANTRDALTQAEAAVAQAQASQANASTTLDRTNALVGRGIAPKQEAEEAAAKAAEAKANVAAANAAADLARRTLGRVAVRSSFAGVVTKVWRGAGALVDGTAATPIVQLAADNALEFAADVTPEELSKIHDGDAVHGSLTEGGDFDGAVRVRARSLDPSTGLGSVRIAVNHPAADVPIGAFGRAVVTFGHRSDVVTLPTSALRGSVADGAEIAICKSGKIELRAVKVGWRSDERFEITDGFKADERAAIDHVLGLDDDTSIIEAK